MLRQIIRQFRLLPSGFRSRSKYARLVGQAVAVENAIYFYVHRFDSEGNDFVFDVTDAVSMDASHQVLGSAMIQSMNQSEAVREPFSVEFKKTRWMLVLQKMGFKSERAAALASDVVMLSGERDVELVQQPCVLKCGVFVGSSDAHVVRTPWEAADAGAQLKRLFALIRSGKILAEETPED